MDRDLLIDIRTWYEDQLHDLKNEFNQKDARWYYRKRILQINLMLSTIDETEYLDSLDALFLKKKLDSLNVEPCESDQDFAEVNI
tara:strand:+ start:526 stop:780 length:255 start_codon:yes stop_codon:yes gene_type:complete